jgi:ribosomal protein L2
LYTAPFIWIRYNDAEQKGAFVKFTVRDIEYDSKRNISYLLITDNNGNARYEFGKKRQMQSTIDFGKEVTV